MSFGQPFASIFKSIPLTSHRTRRHCVVCKTPICGRTAHVQHNNDNHKRIEVYFAILEDLYYLDRIWRCYHCTSASHNLAEVLASHPSVKLVHVLQASDFGRHPIKFHCIVCMQGCTGAIELNQHYKEFHGFDLDTNAPKLLISQAMEGSNLTIRKGKLLRDTQSLTGSQKNEASESHHLKVQDVNTGRQEPMYIGSTYGDFHGLSSFSFSHQYE